MAAPISSQEALEALDLVVAELGDPGIVRSRMMGRPVLTLAGTMFAVLNGDALGLKLGAGTPVFAEARALEGAGLLDPGGKGRPFKDWVALPLEHAAVWPGYAADALDAARQR
jgi:hypothetical protein